jgi:SAM-dependent methyltransferase
MPDRAKIGGRCTDRRGRRLDSLVVSAMSRPADRLAEEDEVSDLRRRRSVSQTFLSELLKSLLAEWSTEHAGREVVDLGGGTGGMAMGLGAAGFRVRVVDPSPDALAALERRTAEAGLGDTVTGVQGDAADLVDLLGSGCADLVVCHKVLDVVESPAAALAALFEVLRPGGALSLIVAQRHAAVLTQALAGHIAQARRTWADPDRYDRSRILGLVSAAGFELVASHGVGTVADHVTESVLDSEPGAHAELLALEAEVAGDSAFQALAPHLHVFAVRPPEPDRRP